MSSAAERWFHQHATSHVVAALLSHLSDLGVVQRLAERGPATADELATALGLAPRPLETVLSYLAAVDPLLNRDPAGAFTLTAFGRDVVARYGRRGPDGLHLNLFAVRVGAYGPIWQAVPELLRGEAYGGDIRRRGDLAARALYAVANQLLLPLLRVVDELGVDTLVEVGVTTGLVAAVAAARPGLHCVGLDRSEGALDEARALGSPSPNLRWVRADAFDVDGWTSALPAGRTLVFTIHLHELLAAGEPRVCQWLGEVAAALPNGAVLGFEQPLLHEEDRESTDPSLWSYAASNVLIHHLVGVGRILDHESWCRLFGAPGGSMRSADPLNYLGYRAYLRQHGADHGV